MSPEPSDHDDNQATPDVQQKYFYFKPMDGEQTIANFNIKRRNNGGIELHNVNNIIQNLTISHGSTHIKNSDNIKLIGNRFISAGRIVYIYTGSSNVDLEGNLIYGGFGFSSGNKNNLNAKTSLLRSFGSNEHTSLLLLNTGNDINVKIMLYLIRYTRFVLEALARMI